MRPPRSISAARRKAALALLGCAAGAVFAVAAWRLPGDAARRGERLFSGEEPLAAEIYGQDLPLPAEATRCQNCHSEAPGRGASELAAPPLDAGVLLTKRARRNGPPSRYDARTFCTLLRTGVDPAHIQLPRVMPRYALDDAQCTALFAYLTER